MPQTRTAQCSYSAVDADIRTEDSEDDTQLSPHIGKLIRTKLLSNNLKSDKYPQICSSLCGVPPMHKHQTQRTDLLGACAWLIICVWKYLGRSIFECLF